jgi:Hydantoinase B/oxoprolinase
MHQVCLDLRVYYFHYSPHLSNLTFGAGGKDSSGTVKSGWGYYETIAGGSGAGPGWHGTSGVHTHITNTRIGDPEILERRYPVLLHRFEIRNGSGGKGEYHGGDGVVREFEFLQNLQVSILSEVSEPTARYWCGEWANLDALRGVRDNHMDCMEESQLNAAGISGLSSCAKKTAIYQSRRGTPLKETYLLTSHE